MRVHVPAFQNLSQAVHHPQILGLIATMQTGAAGYETQDKSQSQSQVGLAARR